ncbi:hypothetical protein HU200_025578 [Digitaria exilis]|uniref:PUM-HD domain-containing protein n=1 Tax=Digitaria exilis TaxID=1010633 RepID=A0A835EW58_9POAL|nr:hypothetical protein HU200_025578 [Digitaria exilis]CAB3496824.1 unnamed protein product [Digitaria exilis]
MEMRGAKAAAAAAERTEEKEMDLLLREIPHVTSPQGQRGAIGHGNGVHGAAAGHGYAAQGRGEDAYYSMALHRRDDAAPLQGGGGAPGGVPFAAPLPVVSAPSPVSGPFVGSAPPPLARAVDDPEQQWLANHLRELRIGDAPAAGAQSVLQRHGPPPVKSAVPTPTDASAARDAYHGYNFAAPGSSVHHEPVFLDQTKAVGYVAARPQRFVSDVGFDAYGGFPRGLDTSIGGLVYNRVGHGTGIGWGQGLVHPDLADSYMLSRHSGAEFFCPSPVALDVRGWPKLQYAYTVPVADNGFARSGNQFEAFHSENSLMFDGKKNMNFIERGRERRVQQFVNNRALDLGNSRTPRYENMVRVKEYIYLMAKDQYGCRYLQQKFEEGKHHVDVIFEGIINHIADLMINSFANYLVQKMLEVCAEEQRLRIIAVLTQDPVRLVAISLNMHGTRAVQKLIETVTTREQVVLIISALQPGFMELVNDLNGNHVIQKCLTNFGAEENKFIFEAAAANCFNMAVHRHGCCVLQRCISSARGGYQAKLIVEICAHGFELAQDPFGNYVVQYVLNLKIPSANAHLASQFEGRYLYLSKQKVSSNVVEKCLKLFPDDAKAVIVRELLSGSHFEQLLQDPYANYVIYTALLNTRGHLHNALVEAIRPHEDAIRTSPCCKRISRALSRR